MPQSAKGFGAGGAQLLPPSMCAQTACPKTVLETTAQAVGWQALLNTRSTTWRGLDDAEKSDMTEAKALALMAQHPTLIKRPLIIGAQTGAGIMGAQTGAGIIGTQTGAGIMGAQTTVGWTKVQQEIWLN